MAEPKAMGKNKSQLLFKCNLSVVLTNDQIDHEPDSRLNLQKRGKDENFLIEKVELFFPRKRNFIDIIQLNRELQVFLFWNHFHDK